MPQRCSYEDEIRQLVARGRWPASSTPELRAHAASCRACGDLVLVAVAFQNARAEALAAAKPIPASVLWWRAQLRQRTEAVERISRPIQRAQIFALAMNLLMAVGFAVWQARHGLAWLTWLQQAPAQPFDSSSLGTQGFGFQGLGFLWSSALSGSGWNWMVLLPAAATLALLGGVVVYLALEEQ